VSGSRPVYQTGRGRLCPRCGWPIDDCRCSKPDEDPVPARIACALRIEKKGRGGKTVTVVAGLPRNQAFLAGLAAELKRACGTGGTATEDAVEVQGDHRERLRPLLAAKGWMIRS
jgi:translation initiation factor 1